LFVLLSTNKCNLLILDKLIKIILKLNYLFRRSCDLSHGTKFFSRLQRSLLVHIRIYSRSKWCNLLKVFSVRFIQDLIRSCPTTGRSHLYENSWHLCNHRTRALTACDSVENWNRRRRNVRGTERTESAKFGFVSHRINFLVNC